ncbi:GNAT family N-acetyltransferase [Flammeovirga kamogawensis]|uniref:GNAT family N-acetyltransferase n=1 Tax=Flammeovirga kamogawensis TaxID=373891 RepID=A0ABX8GR42_9BACT|nr:GNAT family N-acetyltransferase [Flammeovirga kamogawensis]MBB6462007.1 GNAT superfamily N-acetyltransferase [Flammeovirga kamogawensis]QWG05747.1 GNAT family N-acetyltransferase [Flammeovirga kamogawensis]TRX67572.1 GNAT family N-acetyltransferase [Flammeovirga kamogawensis]
MNKEITNNLFEFWEEIGNSLHKLNISKNYKSIEITDSDWPNRIFDIHTNEDGFSTIIQLSREAKLPAVLTVEKPNTLNKNTNLKLVFGQLNMALNLSSEFDKLKANPNIIEVTSKNDIEGFASTASASFGYYVDKKVIAQIIEQSNKIKLFLYKLNNKYLGCGMIFIDASNNAGLHMIGTLPEGRGKGIGKSITERLIIEAKRYKSNYCVLNASLMGKPIYEKLGFKPYGELQTYRVLENN